MKSDEEFKVVLKEHGKAEVHSYPEICEQGQ